MGRAGWGESLDKSPKPCLHTPVTAISTERRESAEAILRGGFLRSTALSEPAQKPSCGATTRAGNPCRHPVVLTSGFCPTHDADHHVSRLFGPGAQHTTGYQTPARPRTLQVLAAFAEQQMERIVQPYDQGLSATIVIRNKDGDILAEVDDWETRLKTAETLLDRTSGKPRQSVDTTIEAGESLAALLAPTPLERTDYERLPEGWEGTDG